MTFYLLETFLQSGETCLYLTIKIALHNSFYKRLSTPDITSLFGSMVLYIIIIDKKICNL